MTELLIENLTYPPFDQLNFQLSHPGLYGVIGSNGAGKSTFFSVINGEIDFKQGTIQVGKIAYVPTLEIFDPNLTAKDYINLLHTQEKKRFKQLVSNMGGVDFFHKKIGHYSLGMKELFSFLFSLSVESDLLILDELIDGLDEKKRQLAYKELEKEASDKIILFTSHNLSEVFQHCPVVYLLERAGIKEVENLEEAKGCLGL